MMDLFGLHGTPLLIVVFSIIVIIMLILDLGVFHREAHKVSVKEALIWSAVWISLSMAFNVYLYYALGQNKEAAIAFFSGYLIEKSLSVDNLFVFMMLFGFFKVPAIYQHRILFWGILGALIIRAIFIFLGVALIEQFHWTIYILGAFLVYTGIHTMFKSEDSEEVHPDQNPIIKILKKIVPIKPGLHHGKFFIRENAKIFVTTPFVVLVLVETTDIAFAVDSIPAILAITTDPFLVYSSNIFAILGLRSLYFALSGVMTFFRYLHIGLGIILSFVGVKMLIEGYYKIDTMMSLVFIGIVLVITALVSLIPLAAVKTLEQGKGKAEGGGDEEK
jgi:tellurite resistance protein TerC